MKQFPCGVFLVSTDHGDHEDILSNRYAQIRVIRWRYKNQRDFTDETDSMRQSHLTGTDVRLVRPSIYRDIPVESTLERGRTGRTSVPANSKRFAQIREIRGDIINMMKQFPCGVFTCLHGSRGSRGFSV